MEEEIIPGGAAPAEGEESGGPSPDCSREVHTASLLEGEASMTASIEPRDLESRAAGAQVSFSSADHPEHDSWRRRGGAAWWRAQCAKGDKAPDGRELCCLCGRGAGRGCGYSFGVYQELCEAPLLFTTGR